MMRRLLGTLVACALAVLVAACGGANVGPTPNPGGGGNGGSQQPPPAINTPPQVKSITVSDARVEAGAPVTLTAVVEDAETPVTSLSYAWTFPPGSITGTSDGSTVTYTPSADLKTPGDFEIGVIVTERYTSAGVQAENKATGSVTLHVNNSTRELSELSLRFLGDFVNSSVSPEKCVAEFTDSCRGKKDEFADIDDNRHDFVIIASNLRHTGLQIAPTRLSATVHTFCSFTSKVITTQPREENCQHGECPLNSVGTAQGDCWTTNVYEKGRWWICESHFTSQTTLSPMMRAFFGMPRLDVR
jgi:hypothetical protein